MLLKFTFATMFSLTAYYIWYNVHYMDEIAANRIKAFEQESGMRISEFKTENPIPEEIRPEYIEKQKRKYRHVVENNKK